MNYSKEVRQGALKAIMIGMKVSEAARVFGINTKTIYNWTNGYNATTRASKVTKNGPEGHRTADRYIRAHADEPGFIEAFLESKQCIKS